MKVAFDIGGVISRHPETMKDLMRALLAGGVEVFILTDMGADEAHAACVANGLGFLPRTHVLSADWAAHGDRCKSEVIREQGIDVLVDDRPDYCAEGDFIGLVLSPRPGLPYYHPSWVLRDAPAILLPPSEYASFLSWKEAQRPETPPSAPVHVALRGEAPAPRVLILE